MTPGFRLAILLLLLPPVAGRSDRVELKNGRTVEGIVIEDTPRGVVLEISGGRITFSRPAVKDVILTGLSSNQLIASAWRDKRFLEKENVPSGLEELAARFRHLEKLRREAILARDAMDRSAGKLRQLERERERTRQDLVAESARLQGMTPRTDPGTYNDAVARNNSLRAAITRQEAALETELAEGPKRMKAVSTYLGSLQSCSQSLDRAQADLTASSRTAPTQFIARLTALLSGYSRDFRSGGIQTTVRGNATLVQVMVNGRSLGHFVLDTGASIMTVSRAFAQGAGISEDTSGPPLNLSVADGRRVKAYPARIATLRIGEVEAKDVAVAVMPSPPGEGVDGLLGMNVLKSFLVRIDPATGGLHLDHFNPQ